MMIRKLRKGDADGAYACEKISLPEEAWSETDIAEMENRSDRLYFVAEEDGRIAGTASALLSCDEMFIINIAVIPEYRMRGLAFALLSALTDAACSAGCIRAVLEVAETNTAAISLYTASSFAVCGRRKGLREINMLIMERNFKVTEC